MEKIYKVKTRYVFEGTFEVNVLWHSNSIE